MMGAMSFSDTVFLFFLALIIFGPKKLPEMARQAGKLLAELRRASNEFRSQIETEIAHLEVAERKQTALPPPQGTVASLSVNPAVTESLPHPPEATATLATPTAVGSVMLSSNPDGSNNTTPVDAGSVTSEAASGIAASQESHA
jgi:sec-independent protein translocase protein TatB